MRLLDCEGRRRLRGGEKINTTNVRGVGFGDEPWQGLFVLEKKCTWHISDSSFSSRSFVAAFAICILVAGWICVILGTHFAQHIIPVNIGSK